jgi:cobalt/nickel transport system permease protein
MAICPEWVPPIMHIDIDRFSKIESIVSCWDTRFKIVSLFTLLVCISQIKTIETALLAFFISLLMVLIARLPLASILRKSFYPLLFMLPLFIILLATSGGEVMAEYGFIRIYINGLNLSLLIMIKIFSILMLFFVTFSTSPFNKTAYAFRLLRFPSKLVNLFLFSYRYIFVYLEDLRRMRRALVLRGFRNRSSLASFRSNANLIGSLLVNSFEQTDQIYKSMRIRGFEGDLVSLDEFRFGPSDLIKAIFVLSLSAFIILKEQLKWMWL